MNPLIVLGIIFCFILGSIALSSLLCKVIDWVFDLREKHIYKKYPEYKKLCQELKTKQSIYSYQYNKVWLPICSKIDDMMKQYQYIPLYMRKEFDVQLESLREDYVRANADMINAKADRDNADRDVRQFQKKHNIKW